MPNANGGGVARMSAGSLICFGIAAGIALAAAIKVHPAFFIAFMPCVGLMAWTLGDSICTAIREGKG